MGKLWDFNENEPFCCPCFRKCVKHNLAPVLHGVCFSNHPLFIPPPPTNPGPLSKTQDNQRFIAAGNESRKQMLFWLHTHIHTVPSCKWCLLLPQGQRVEGQDFKISRSMLSAEHVLRRDQTANRKGHFGRVCACLRYAADSANYKAKIRLCLYLTMFLRIKILQATTVLRKILSPTDDVIALQLSWHGYFSSEI